MKVISWIRKFLELCYRGRKDNKATISNIEDETIELPTGVDKIKLTENATKETEGESNKLDKKAFRAMRKLES
jgi:hypothetical protein